MEQGNRSRFDHRAPRHGRPLLVNGQGTVPSRFSRSPSTPYPQPEVEGLGRGVDQRFRQRLARLHVERRDADAERARLESLPARQVEPYGLHRAQWADFAARRRLRELVEDLREASA